jgi:hypothetical protein
MSNKPIHKLWTKGISVAAWEGRYGLTFTVSKQYKDKETGEYKDSKSYFESDIEILRNMLTEMIDYAKSRSSGAGSRDTVKHDTSRVEAIAKSVVEENWDVPF